VPGAGPGADGGAGSADGRHHDIQTCYEVTEVVLRSLFDALYNQNVMLEGTILKASMIVPGKDSGEQASVEDVAENTLMCLKTAVPAILPGIVFLSGGQSDEDATAHLDAMNRMGPNPWPLSFSYGRAMQSAALPSCGPKDPEGQLRGGAEDRGAACAQRKG
jgi:fructose-bisphosphate aldolase class I